MPDLKIKTAQEIMDYCRYIAEQCIRYGVQPEIFIVGSPDRTGIMVDSNYWSDHDITAALELLLKERPFARIYPKPKKI